jgi:uncharacterized protein (TIGR03435 family)
MRLLIALACVALVVPIVAADQQNAPASPTFDVASVKKSAPPGNGPMRVTGGTRRGDRWFAGYATLRMLIQGAYAPRFQMEGLVLAGPAWINTDRFDVDATMAPGTTTDDMRAMARALLADRFKLVAHAETRDLQVYALVLARGDGKLGAKMRRSEVDCEALREARENGTAPPIGPPRAGEPMAPCTTRVMFGPLSRIESSGMALAQFVGLLSLSTDRPIVDRTGLSGDYVVSLEFLGEPAAGSPQGAPAPAASPPPGDAASLFTALQEQLGLKLDARREPTEVLMIDSVEQPTAD